MFKSQLSHSPFATFDQNSRQKLKRSFKGEVVFSEKEESYFEYEIENSDAEGLHMCDDITMNKMREKDVMSKKEKKDSFILGL